mmetsp:Transcript_2661/g.6759  ORF Transcript_2661/g.6759 Transcript_2661/m.6759 type:complete len:439 (-) Transcript_2661:55-1371(-)
MHPEGEHARGGGEREHAVVQLHGCGVLKAAAQPAVRRLKVLLRHPLPVHGGKRVVRPAGVIAGDKRPRQRRHADEGGQRVGQPAELEGRLQHLGLLLEAGQQWRGRRDAERGPDERGVDGERGRQVASQPVGADAGRRVRVVTLLWIPQPAAHHPPAHQALRAAHQEQQAEAARQRCVDEAASSKHSRGSREQQPQHARPHAVAVLHPEDELELIQRHAGVHLPELRGVLVLPELHLPVLVRQRGRLPRELPLRHGEPRAGQPRYASDDHQRGHPAAGKPQPGRQLSAGGVREAGDQGRHGQPRAASGGSCATRHRGHGGVAACSECRVPVAAGRQRGAPPAQHCAHAGGARRGRMPGGPGRGRKSARWCAPQLDPRPQQVILPGWAGDDGGRRGGRGDTHDCRATRRPDHLRQQSARQDSRDDSLYSCRHSAGLLRR